MRVSEIGIDTEKRVYAPLFVIGGLLGRVQIPDYYNHKDGKCRKENDKRRYLEIGKCRAHIPNKPSRGNVAERRKERGHNKNQLPPVPYTGKKEEVIESNQYYGHGEKMEMRLFEHTQIAFRLPETLFRAPVILCNPLRAKPDFQIQKQGRQPQKYKEDNGKNDYQP